MLNIDQQNALRNFLNRYTNFCDGCFYCEWDFQMAIKIVRNDNLSSLQYSLNNDLINIVRK